MHKHLTIKNTAQELQLFQRRVLVLGAAIAICLLALVSRLIYLQILQHNFYQTLSQQNQLSLIPIEPNRGLIYDRNGVLLADNIPVFNLSIIPDHVNNLNTTIANLQKIIAISEDDIRQFRKQLKQRRRFDSVPLKMRLTEPEVARFAVDQYRFPGVEIKAQLIRYYPLGATMVHALGYVGRINENELTQVDPINYSATNYIGKLGVEKFYEDQLHGKVGYQQVEIDASGRVVRVLKKVLPVPGDNLYLSIDSKLQIAAEKALGDERGAVVAIEPKTGQVLALVSNPSYDPNQFVQGISQQDFKALQSSEGQPLYNRALRGQYPFGSTTKPFIGLQGLETGTITPDDTIFDPGWFQLKNSTHIYHDWKRTGHGEVDLTDAIIQSCDTYYYNLAMKLGIDRIDDILTRFGFGNTTGIDMGEELPGLVPSPEWKRRTHGKSWYPGDTLISGIGQGFMLTTPLQLAVATSALANRGVHFQPSLLLKSQIADGRITAHQPVALPQITIQNANWDVVIDAMHEVVSSPFGTAYRIGQDAPYAFAAKTGTAQVFSLKQDEKYNSDILPERLRDNSTFIAFAPLANPQIAVAVIVEHSHSAALIARKVMDAYLIKTKSG